MKLALLEPMTGPAHTIPEDTINFPLTVTSPLNVDGAFPKFKAFLVLTPLVILAEFLIVTPNFVHKPVKLLTAITFKTPK